MVKIAKKVDFEGLQEKIETGGSKPSKKKNHHPPLQMINGRPLTSEDPVFIRAVVLWVLIFGMMSNL